MKRKHYLKTHGHLESTRWIFLPWAHTYIRILTHIFYINNTRAGSGPGNTGMPVYGAGANNLCDKLRVTASFIPLDDADTVAQRLWFFSCPWVCTFALLGPGCGEQNKTCACYYAIRHELICIWQEGHQNEATWASRVLAGHRYTCIDWRGRTIF